MRWKAILVLALVGLPAAANAQYLFVGLESSTPVTRSSDLEGFPEVEYQDHFAFDVSGAAATPEGLLYLCNGAFTTRLYQATLTETPQLLSTISVDISALAYGNDTLYGFSNYADPKGIYAIDPVTGQATLVLDVYSGTGFRFFALDFNQADGLLYGYTEYGDSGLYSINLDTGEMIKLANTIPASNGQGRGMAVGNNTVFLTATRGDDQIPCFAYDIAQGVGGQWVAFTNPYPDHHATGGAAWIPDPTADVPSGPTPVPEWRLRIHRISPSPTQGGITVQYQLSEAGEVQATIYDVTGRRHAVLPARIVPGGSHTFSWNGRDDAGLMSSPGIYMLRLEANGATVGGSVRIVR
jgi:hypothetical protein